MTVPDDFLVLVLRISLLTLYAQKARAETGFLRCQQNGRFIDTLSAPIEYLSSGGQFSVSVNNVEHQIAQILALTWWLPFLTEIQYFRPHDLVMLQI